MSASEVLLKRRSSKEECGDVDEDGFQETEERKRFLAKVEEGANLIRALNLLTRPIEEKLWGEEKYKILSTPINVSNSPRRPLKSVLSSPSVVSKENKPKEQVRKKVSFTPQKRMRLSEDTEQEVCSSSSPDLQRSHSWSPVKHVKAVTSLSPLKMETTPSWVPLRKSKARKSFVDSMNRSAQDDSSKSMSTSFSKYPAKKEIAASLDPVMKHSSCTQPRSPLTTVKAENETSRKRGSLRFDDSLSLKKKTSSSRIAHGQNQVYSENLPVSGVSSGLSSLASARSTPNKACASSEPYSTPEAEKSDSLSECRTSYSEVPCTPKTPVSHLQSLKSPVRYSPILMKAYGEQRARIHGSIVSPDKVVNPDCVPEGVDPKRVLKDVVAYVEVRRGEDDRTSGFRWKLKQLGATLADSLVKKVTHVVFQEGLLSTFRKAKAMKVHLVSALWVMACDESLSRVSEEGYPIEDLEKYELMDPLVKSIRRPKVMTPDFGSGRDEKRLSRRFKMIQRRSLSVASSPVVTDKEAAAVTAPLCVEPKDTGGVLMIGQSSQLKTISADLLAGKLEYDLSTVNVGVDCDSSKGDGDKHVVSQGNGDKRVALQDDDDSDDGHLAMIEAQVRAKTAKLHAEQLAEVRKNFRKQLQELLGQPKEKEDPPEALASIFTSGKKTEDVSNKSQNRSKIKVKTKMDSSASSSLMMSWIINKSPFAPQPEAAVAAPKSLFTTAGKEMTAAAAADALSDEIIKGTISRNSTVPDVPVSSKPISMPEIPATFELSELGGMESHNDEKIHSVIKGSSPPVDVTISTKVQSVTRDVQKGVRKSSIQQSAKKSKVKKKSEASSGMMMSWLSGNKQKSDSVHENAGGSSTEETTSATKGCNDKENLHNSVAEPVAVTPVKCAPDTPQRRRSARLTPRKDLSPLCKAGILQTVFERHETEISEENVTSKGDIKKTSTPCKSQTSEKRLRKTPLKDDDRKKLSDGTIPVQSTERSLPSENNTSSVTVKSLDNDNQDVAQGIIRHDSGLGEEENTSLPENEVLS